MKLNKDNGNILFVKKAVRSILVIFTSCLVSAVAISWKKAEQRNGKPQNKMNMMHTMNGFYEAHVKRLLDFILAVCALVILSPLMLVVAVLVRVMLGSPVFFRQERPGRDEKIFKLVKFRTMTDKRDKKGELLPDEERLTKFGKFLRSTSLDELPELFNIIKGDMSIVGPRPLLIEYLPRYNRKQARRHEVRPGLTGLAQVNGRNGISWEEKLKLDVEYVDNITFSGDMKIILETVSAVVKRDGITSETSVTMEKFMGSGGILE